MWNISKETKVKFRKYNLLPIHESDHDWELALKEAKEEGEDLFTRLKEELDEVKEELLHVLPSRFIPYLENDTLNQPTLPKTIREDYLQWMREAGREFEQVLDAAFERTKQAIPFLSTAVQDVLRKACMTQQLSELNVKGIHFIFTLIQMVGFPQNRLFILFLKES